MTTLLDEALEAWTDARNGVIAELENIPANQFDAAAGAGARSGYTACLPVRASFTMAPV